ncbi:hypothetical protein A5707_04375 [Mycobacterium kyorinense]|uniref:DUF5642 domain-containing protein n=1 Tax=Mycobacterium kyorinense TaxID=487514 RepID=A0A1A2Z0K8_9MYCO|nr:DUF5642 family protein [Mycobacterium kyorinense]OBI43815.1 hypothetical protein A5707_04375 [Mycobacterium kyorinense]
MRRVWIAAAAAVLTAACGHSPGPGPAPSASTSTHPINPANIKRVGRELPSGYEVRGVSDIAAPPAIWGLAAKWTADPARCGALADPVDGHFQSAQGVSGSGAGGIIYAVVTAAPTHLDPALVADCPHWTMANRRAVARVHLIAAPDVDGAATLGMASETTTSVEGGNEISSGTTTFAAYLGDYYAFAAVVTDPGSPHPSLTPQTAADLLVKTVSALRS